MKIKLIIAAGIALLAHSCINEQMPPFIDTESDIQPVSFTLAISQGTDSNVDYEPMTTKTGETREVEAVLFNTYTTILYKKDVLTSYWIVEKIFDSKFQTNGPSIIDYSRGDSFSPMNLELREGEYKMVLFVNWQGYAFFNADQIKEKMVVLNDIWALRRVEQGERLSNTSAPFSYHICERELFIGKLDFTVSKGNSLGLDPNNTHAIILKRQACKFRVLLKQTGNNGFEEGTNTIFFKLSTTHDQGFCTKINLWGDPVYDDKMSIESKMQTTESWLSNVEGNQYLLPGKTNDKSAQYFWAVPEESIEFSFDYLSVTPPSGAGAHSVKCSGRMLALSANQIVGVVIQTDRNDYENDPISGLPVYKTEVVQGEEAKTVVGPYAELNH